MTASHCTPAVHELCHYFSDDPGEMCRYAADGAEQSETEGFCERFAWYCVDRARGSSCTGGERRYSDAST